MLATLRDRMVAADGSLVPWRSPGGRPMAVAAAAPFAGWSDFAYALVPNGRALDYTVPRPGDDLEPMGVVKQSMLEFVYDIAQANYTAPAGVDPGADLHSWYQRLSDGEPYGEDAEAVVRELAAHHSALFLPTATPPAPILIAQGTTDDLFPASEALRYYNRMRALHPGVAVALILIDDGHARAVYGNGYEEVTRRTQAWFDHFVKGVGPRPFDGVEAWTQTCPAPSIPGGPYFADSWPALHPGEVRLRSAARRLVRSTGGDQATADAVAPAEGHECAATSVDDAPGTATYTLPPAPPGGYVLMGSPTVAADVTVSGTWPELAARLWDVSPGDGRQTLVTRGVSRPFGSGRRTFQLEANGWRFAPGHAAKLELLARDAPYARASNGSFTLDVSKLDLRLPVLESPGSSAAVGWPAAPFLPPGARLAPGVSASGGPPPAPSVPAARRGLRLSLAYRGDGSCPRRVVIGTIHGPGVPFVRQADFIAHGLRFARDSSAPFRAQVRRGRVRRMRARVRMRDGSRVGLRHPVRRCPKPK